MPTDLTPERLAQIRTRLMAATPGPWRECGRDRDGCMCSAIYSEPADIPVALANAARAWGWPDGHPTSEQEAKNARLIAHAPTDIGDLLVALADSVEEANDIDQRLRKAEAVIGAAQRYRACPNADERDDFDEAVADYHGDWPEPALDSGDTDADRR